MIFTLQMFGTLGPGMLTRDDAMKAAQAAFDKWLAEQPVVWTRFGNKYGRWEEVPIGKGAEYRARLVAFERIER